MWKIALAYSDAERQRDCLSLLLNSDPASSYGKAAKAILSQDYSDQKIIETYKQECPGDAGKIESLVYLSQNKHLRFLSN